jgi:translocation and assembly module TamB
VQNDLADLVGSVDLLIRGSIAAPVLYGEVGLERGGTFSFSGTDYQIERGRILFTNPYRLDPEVDLLATARVRDFDVLLALQGTFDRLETRFSSEPPLPDLEVFRLLANGEDAAGGSSSFETRPARRVHEDPSTSAATFLYGQAASVIGKRVNTLFGFDKFRIDPLTGSGDNLSKARVTVGKRLSKDVFLTFSTAASSNETQRLQIEWQASPGLKLVLTQNSDDTYSADARWEASF